QKRPQTKKTAQKMLKKQKTPQSPTEIFTKSGTYKIPKSGTCQFQDWVLTNLQNQVLNNHKLTAKSGA
ncbi:unnamed protein product, partial [marine sediment metagenome]